MVQVNQNLSPIEKTLCFPIARRGLTHTFVYRNPLTYHKYMCKQCIINTRVTTHVRACIRSLGAVSHGIEESEVRLGGHCCGSLKGSLRGRSCEWWWISSCKHRSTDEGDCLLPMSHIRRAEHYPYVCMCISNEQMRPVKIAFANSKRGGASFYYLYFHLHSSCGSVFISF